MKLRGYITPDTVIDQAQFLERGNQLQTHAAARVFPLSGIGKNVDAVIHGHQRTPVHHDGWLPIFPAKPLDQLFQPGSQDGLVSFSGSQLHHLYPLFRAKNIIFLNNFQPLIV